MSSFSGSTLSIAYGAEIKRLVSESKTTKEVCKCLCYTWEEELGVEREGIVVDGKESVKGSYYFLD